MENPPIKSKSFGLKRDSETKTLISVGQSLFFRFSALALGAIILFGVGYLQFGLRPVVLSIADGQFDIAANRVEDLLQQTFEPIEGLIGVVGEWGVSPGFSVDRPQEFNLLFRPILAQMPQVTSIVAGTTEGEGWLLLQLPDGRWHSRFTDIPRWGGEHLFIDEEKGSIHQEERRGFDYDPRTRPWFMGAKSASYGQPHWTPPYVLFTTKQPGISVSSRHALPDGRDLVVGFDLDLLDISQVTSAITVGQEGCVLVMTADGRVLGLPRDDDSGSMGNPPLLQRVEDLPTTSVRAGVDAWRSEGGLDEGILRFSHNGRPWLGSFRPFSLGEQTFWVAAFAPEKDFIPPWQSVLQVFGVILLLVLGLSLLAARRQALRFSAPLKHLAANSERIANLDFGESPPVQTNYREFHQLAQAQESMRAMLKEFRDTVETQAFNLQGALSEKQAILDNALVGIGLLRNGTILQHNRRASEILGYSGQSITGLSTEELYPDRSSFIATGKRIQTALQRGENFVEELWLKRRDGSRFWGRLSGRALDPAMPADGSVWILADLTDQKSAEDRLHYLGNHDSLTGLPNRHLFNDRLEHAVRRAQREKEQVALFSIDLDNFKAVNETQGHAFGDRLLCAISQNLRSSLRPSDTLARMGGDEFAVLIESVTGTSKILKVAGKLMEAFSTPLKVDGRPVYMSASIGISVYPADGEDGKILLQNAEVAMYQAKGQGRNTYYFYSQEMTLRAFSRLEIEDSLRRSLEHGGLEFHYQPQICLADGSITGAEALVRLRHPEKGLIPPLEFIPLAEESGLIFQLGNRALEESCRMWTSISQKGFRLPSIAVNVSAKQLKRGDFSAVIKSILAAAGLPPSAIELEITETAFLESEGALDLLRELADYGMNLALDDFGTGYSSLSYLKRLPFKKLKIDKGFVQAIGQDEDGETLVRTIINLADTMGLEVIAEGVETQAQVDFLLREGCRVAQGYFFAKPMPEDIFCEWLKEQTVAEL